MRPLVRQRLKHNTIFNDSNKTLVLRFPPLALVPRLEGWWEDLGEAAEDPTGP